MFSYKYETRYGDYKDCENIKPSSILDMVQDVSTKASAECGYGMEKMQELGLAWLVQGINVRFDKRITPFDPIKLSTAVKPCNGVTSERCCIIEQKGEIVGRTVSNWFIFNVGRKRPTRIPKEMQEAYEVGDFADEVFNYKKVELQKIEDPEYTIRISNKELDTNNHLNNQKGAELLMDALPFDFYFNEINVLFKNPSFLGEELEVCRVKTEKGFYVHIQTKEKEIRVAGTFEFV